MARSQNVLLSTPSTSARTGDLTHHRGRLPISNMPVTGSEITSSVNLEECFPEKVSTEERIEMATRCHDMASVPKVQKAGRIENLEDGTRAQIMHNGSLVLADSYQGPWMTTLIERCGGYHEPQEERV